MLDNKRPSPNREQRSLKAFWYFVPCNFTEPGVPVNPPEASESRFPGRRSRSRFKRANTIYRFAQCSNASLCICNFFFTDVIFS